MYIILTQCFPSRSGGIESLVSNLALSIGKNEKVIVLADQHNILQDAIYDNEHKKKITIKRYAGIKFFRRQKKNNELKTFIKFQKIKFVIADTWKSIEFCADELIYNNIPIVCLAHGNELFGNTEKKKKRIRSSLLKSSIIIVNSNFTSGLVNQLIGKQDKIKIVYPGANDLHLVKPDTSFTINGNPVLLTLSRLEKRKGHIFILKAVKKLQKKFPDIKYIIAGEGDEKYKLQHYVASNELYRNVVFVGNVNDEQKKQLFDHTDIMVMPTLDESKNRSIEGFGIAYMEAAFFGIPSIASNIGGTPEAVLHDKTGIIIQNHQELFNALNDLLINNQKLKNLGQNAKERAEKLFTWKNVVKNYLLAIKDYN